MTPPSNFRELLEEGRRKDARFARTVRYVESFLPGFMEENGYYWIQKPQYQLQHLVASTITGHVPGANRIEGAPDGHL